MVLMVSLSNSAQALVGAIVLANAASAQVYPFSTSASSYGYRKSYRHENLLCPSFAGDSWQWRHGVFNKRQVKVSVVASSPLVECETIRLDWSNDAIPDNSLLAYHVLATAVWLDKSRAGEQEINLPSQEFLTPGSNIEWKVNYPAGTIVEVEVKAEDGSLMVEGVSATMVVKRGAENATCIPASRFPIVVNFPDELRTCEPVKVSWKGGVAPFSVFARGKYGVQSLNVLDNGSGQYSVDWLVNFPEGDDVNLYISSMGHWESDQYKVMKVQRGRRDFCVPKEHMRPTRSAFTHPLAIVLYVVIGLGVVGGIISGAYHLFYYFQYRKAIRLPEDLVYD